MSFIDIFEGKGKWAFHPWIGLWVWGFIALSHSVVRCCFLGMQPINSAVIAFLGALMACLGAFTIARPIIRAGGYKNWLEKEHKIGGGAYQPDHKELAESTQQKKDALAVNIIGPSLAVVGTLMNGLSGFMPV